MHAEHCGISCCSQERGTESQQQSSTKLQTDLELSYTKRQKQQQPSGRFCFPKCNLLAFTIEIALKSDATDVNSEQASWSS